MVGAPDKRRIVRTPLFIAGGLTLVVVVVGAVILLGTTHKEWQGWRAVAPNEIGDFLAGFAGTIAFIWLVAGFYLQFQQLGLQRADLTVQQRTLDKQIEELGLQRQETAKLVHGADRQATASETIQDMDARDLAFRLLEIGREELNTASHLIYHRWLMDERKLGHTPQEYNGQLKTQFDNSDRQIFARQLADDFRRNPSQCAETLRAAFVDKNDLPELITGYFIVLDTISQQFHALGQWVNVQPFLVLYERVGEGMRSVIPMAGVDIQVPDHTAPRGTNKTRESGGLTKS